MSPCPPPLPREHTRCAVAQSSILTPPQRPPESFLYSGCSPKAPPGDGQASPLPLPLWDSRSSPTDPGAPPRAHSPLLASSVLRAGCLCHSCPPPLLGFCSVGPNAHLLRGCCGAPAALTLTFQGVYVPGAPPLRRAPLLPLPSPRRPLRGSHSTSGTCKGHTRSSRGHADTSHRECVLGSIRQEDGEVDVETFRLQGRNRYKITKQMASPILSHFPTGIPFLSPCNDTEFIFLS